MCRFVSLSLFLAIFCLNSYVHALPEDFEQEAIVLADAAEFDRKQGVVIYTGNVEFTQGTLRIDSDRLTVYGTDDQMEKVIAQGSPAHYQQQIKANGPLTYAEALTIEYYANTQQAVLIGQAKIRQEGNQMSGEHIYYDMNKELLQAGKTGDQPTRIKVIIQPQKDENKP